MEKQKRQLVDYHIVQYYGAEYSGTALYELQKQVNKKLSEGYELLDKHARVLAGTIFREMGKFEGK